MTDEQLNEDVLLSTEESKERVDKVIREAAEKKKRKMRQAITKIYTVSANKPVLTATSESLKFSNLKTDGHIIEIVQGDKKIKVGSDLFVNMAKGYFSEVIKEQTAMKNKIYEQSQEIKSLKAIIQRVEKQSGPTQLDEGRYLREIQALRTKVIALERKLSDK